MKEFFHSKNKFIKGQYIKIIVLICLLKLHYSFSLTLDAPLNWKQKPEVPVGIILRYISPTPANQFSPNLTVSKSSAKKDYSDLRSPLDLAIKIEKAQIRMFPMFKVLDKSERKIGAVSGAILAIQYAYGPLDLAAFQYVYRSGDEVVTVVYTCLAKDLERFRPEFEKSLATLKP